MELEKKYKTKAFTLVELIVVITILAILGTIAFLSLQGYSTSARNSTRVSDLSSIKSSLELYALKVGKFPDPSSYSTITYSGGAVWYQGTVGDSVIKNLGTLNKNPKDPLVGNEYSYSITNTKGEYQLGTIEEGGYGYKENEIIQNSYAANINARAIITGNYNGQLLKMSTGGLDYILALPGIVTTDIAVTNMQTILSNQTLAYNGYGNLPGSYNGKGYTMTGSFNYGPANPVVFVGNINTLVSSGTLQQSMINSLQTTYNGTQLTTDPNIARLLTTTTAVDKENLMRSMINNKLGGVVSTIGVLPSVTSTSVTISTSTPAVCGSSHNSTGSTAPVSNLCSVGTLSGSVMGSGPWNWTCLGISGGANADCIQFSNFVNGACTSLPSNAIYYNSTTSYSLVNATSGTTLSAVTAGYSANPTSNTCQYKCNSNSTWNGTSCIVYFTHLIDDPRGWSHTVPSGHTGNRVGGTQSRPYMLNSTTEFDNTMMWCATSCKNSGYLYAEVHTNCWPYGVGSSLNYSYMYCDCSNSAYGNVTATDYYNTAGDGSWVYHPMRIQ